MAQEGPWTWGDPPPPASGCLRGCAHGAAQAVSEVRKPPCAAFLPVQGHTGAVNGGFQHLLEQPEVTLHRNIQGWGASL